MQIPNSSPYADTQDQRIRNDVLRQLTWQIDIGPNEIIVNVKNGIVYLSGRVETLAEREEAEEVSKAPYGVTSVVNEIRVEPKCHRSDSMIRADLLQALRMATICVLEEMPVVRVHDGVVTLAGRCRWQFQKRSAERTALGISGVKAVHNLIEISSDDCARAAISMRERIPARSDSEVHLIVQ
jgi:osmotically-inducible protein OsmY